MGRMVLEAEAFKPLATRAALYDMFQSTGASGISGRQGRFHFPDADEVYISSTFKMLDTYDSAQPLVFTWDWYTTGTTGNVRWTIKVAAITALDAATIEDKAPDTENVADESVPGTTKQVRSSTMTLANKDSVAKDDRVALIISRNGIHGNDTNNGHKVWFLGGVLEWTDE